MDKVGRGDGLLRFVLGEDADGFLWGKLLELVIENSMESMEESLDLLKVNFKIHNPEYLPGEMTDIYRYLADEGYDLESVYLSRSLILIKERLWSSLYDNINDHIEYRKYINEDK